MIYICTANKPLWVKESMSVFSRNIGIIKPGDMVHIQSVQEDWYRVSKGWVYTKDKNVFSSKIENTSKVDILSHIPEKRRGRYFDEDNNDTKKSDQYSSLPSEGDERIFTDSKEQWLEGGTKVTSVNNKDGTWTMIKVRTTEDGVDERYTYTYNEEGTLSTKVEREQRSGYTNTSYIDSDGSRRDVEYEQGDRVGERYRIDTIYDGDGNKVSSTKTKIDLEHGAMSEDDAFDAMSAMGIDSEIADAAGVGGNLTNLSLHNLYGIHGMPYQFMDIVDRTKTMGGVDDSIGRLFADKVVARMPLLMITPGEPEFLAGWSEDEKRDGLNELFNLVDSGSDLSLITQRQGRYYSFKPRWDLYMQYVAPLTQTAAHFLGIADFPAPNDGNLFGGNLATFRWDNFYNQDIHGKLCYRYSIPFYINGETQISDSFSNSVGKSQLEQKVNSFSSIAQEMNFLLGTGASQLGFDMHEFVGAGKQGSSSDMLQNVQNFTDFSDNVLGKGNFLESIAGNIGAVIQGGKLVFPNIWNDSSFSKSYQVQIKLRCPNGDPVSWYFDIWVPLCHLLPLVLPKQAGPNGYIAPFLVRAYFKGIFTCQMGIITDMSISKGEKCNWSLNGLPSSVDVSITIKDLYEIMQVTRESVSFDQYTLMKNIGIMDYIANMCGININEGDIRRTIMMFYYQKRNIVNILGGRIANTFDNWLTNYINALNPLTR